MSHDQRHRYEWKAIPWRKLEVRVFKLQRRIYQATTRGETQKARRLQKLLATSWSAKSLAVRRGTQENKGKKTVVSLNCCDEVLSAEYHNIRAAQGMKVS
jgi:hypothetical protein